MPRINKSIPMMLLSAACLCLGQFVWALMPDYELVYIVGGFGIYTVGAVSMIIAYRYGKLSVLQPMNSMSYVFSTIIAVFILNEKVPPITIAGIIFIICGVIVIGTSNR